jgi:hypothetical protein
MKKLIAFTLLMPALAAFGQIQNEKGRIILDTKDTITGVLSMYNDLDLRVFYLDENNVKQSCALDCVDEIILDNGKAFVSIPDPDNTTGEIFVYKIITGDKISLYGRNVMGEKLLYLVKEEKSYTLKNETKEFTRGNDRFMVKDNAYVSTLKMLMIDRPDLYNEIDQTGFSVNGIEHTLSLYNTAQTDNRKTVPLKAEKKRFIPGWQVYAQYDNYGSDIHANTVEKYSYGFSAGIQMAFTRNGRHNLKLNVGYSSFDMKTRKQGPTLYYSYYYTEQFTGAWLSYAFTFFMTQKTEIYLQAKLLQFGSLKTTNKSDLSDVKTEMYGSPLFSPGVGINFKPIKRVSVFGELNSLLNINAMPLNFSVGVKFDLNPSHRKY